MSKSRVLLSGIIIAIIIVGGWFAVKSYLHLESPFYVVSSEFMVPNLQRGDGVIIRKGDGFSFSDVVIGDIIVFSSMEDRTIIHRVVEVHFEDNQRTLKTKGDANPQSFEGLDYPITEEDYYGKVISVIPKIGAFRYLGS